MSPHFSLTGKEGFCVVSARFTLNLRDKKQQKGFAGAAGAFKAQEHSNTTCVAEIYFMLFITLIPPDGLYLRISGRFGGLPLAGAIFDGLLQTSKKKEC